MLPPIPVKQFRVQPGDLVDLAAWPTVVDPCYKSKKGYQKRLRNHVEELSALQRLHLSLIHI